MLIRDPAKRLRLVDLFADEFIRAKAHSLNIALPRAEIAVGAAPQPPTLSSSASFRHVPDASIFYGLPILYHKQPKRILILRDGEEQTLEAKRQSRGIGTYSTTHTEDSAGSEGICSPNETITHCAEWNSEMTSPDTDGTTETAESATVTPRPDSHLSPESQSDTAEPATLTPRSDSDIHPDSQSDTSAPTSIWDNSPPALRTSLPGETELSSISPTAEAIAFYRTQPVVRNHHVVFAFSDGARIGVSGNTLSHTGNDQFAVALLFTWLNTVCSCYSFCISSYEFY